jgi:dolichyl-phosphate beta-glucosyltransferase
MRKLPPLPERHASAPTKTASLLIPARNAAEALENTVLQARATLSRLFPETNPGGYEIILIPNPRPGDTQDRTIEVARQLEAKFPEVRSVPHLNPQGKGAALRTGFLISRGKYVFFTDADLPYDLDFFRQAHALLENDGDLITGNRRLGTSHFEIPVELLPVAYGRHRLGLAFNSVVRLLFPIRTRDTQAGIKAMSRRLADQAFAQQICPGFFFDLEIFLTAIHRGYRITELPVTLHLNTEKSTVRLARDAILALFWLGRLALRNLRGAYANTH